jgi:hypothetical protein
MTAVKRQMLGTNVKPIRVSVTGMRRVACVLIAVLFGCLATSAQNQRTASTASSDLGRDNLSRVAASAADLKIVLLRDAGLLVELRRWIAHERCHFRALGGGQPVSRRSNSSCTAVRISFAESESRFRTRQGTRIPDSGASQMACATAGRGIVAGADAEFTGPAERSVLQSAVRSGLQHRADKLLDDKRARARARA